MVHKRLGDLLLDEGAITQEQLDKAVAKQQEDGGFLGQVLLQLGFVTQEAVASCLVKQCKIPHLSLLDYDIGPEVLTLIPEEVCMKYHLLPIDKLGRILTVAMVDPLDLEALEAVRQSCTELRIKPILCNYEHFVHVAGKLFSKHGGGVPMTMHSLGLVAQVQGAKPSERANKPAAQPPPPVESSAQAASRPQQAAPQHDPSLDAAVNQAIRQASAPATPAPTPISAADMTDAIRSSVRDAMKEVVGALEQREPKAPAVPAIEPLSAEALASSFRQAFQEAMTAMAQMQVEAPQVVTPPQPSGTELAEMIREGVAIAMEDAMAGMMVQFRALAGRQPAEAPVNDQLMVSMRDSLMEAVRSVQDSQTEQLRQVTEAALQSVKQAAHLIESTAVAEGNRRDLTNRKQRHRSVTPFGRMVQREENDHEEDAQVLDAMESEKPVESFTFDRYFPGNANAFTFKISQAVASSPGKEYNPLFLFGDVGVGKTHLISAIGNAVLHNHPDYRVGYVSASHFARRLVLAMEDQALEEFRENYSHWDMLILDDIQFLGGRIEAQEEFFHIFNVLRQQGRQIIIASDKSPDRLGLLEQRLVSRFASGIVAQLKAPEWEVRMEILRNNARESGKKIPEEILSLIAMRVPHDIRKMTGCLGKLVAFANLVGQDMSCELADEILSHLGAEEAA